MFFGGIKMSYQIYRFLWQGIEIEARYNPLKWNVIAHLEIETIEPARVPLPITKTGYLSHHHQPNSIEAEGNGDVVEFLKTWLDKEAKQKVWQDYIETSRQGELF